MSDMESCRVCGRSVEVMCQRGTGYCSELCADKAEATCPCTSDAPAHEHLTNGYEIPLEVVE